ncbi:PWWP domain containing protein [Trichuris trichiura]|uniref:PWWP domain containing protein n=1 Tax=Trichuris trichiura TaxID=36087 RepID=A0A077ZD40_TRITR|nr:PWWP domain containing protein [Trichuris trichiura]
MCANKSPVDQLTVNVDYKCDYLMMISSEVNGSIYCGVMMKMDDKSDTNNSFAKRLELWKSLSSTCKRDDIPDDPKAVSAVVLRKIENSNLGSSCATTECLNGINHYLRPKRQRKFSASTIQALESRLRTIGSGTEDNGVKKATAVRPCTLKITYGKRARKKTTVINMPDEYAGTSDHSSNDNKANDKQLDKAKVEPIGTVEGPRRLGGDQRRFNVGDVVWAKMKGYSHWPAEVHRLGERKLCVLWCGSSESTGIVPVGAVEPFQDKFADHYNPKHTRAYQNAVAVAMVKEIFNLRAIRHSSLLSSDCQDSLLDLLASLCPKCHCDRMYVN